LIYCHNFLKELLDNQVPPLNLPTWLGSEWGAHLDLWPHALPQGLPKLICELGILIQHNVLGGHYVWTHAWKITFPFLRPWHIGKVLKCICLRCPIIIHLDLICMNYDQKKGRKSNWEFDSRPQIPLKQRSNDLQIRHAIHSWKYFFKGYNMVPSHAPKKIDLKKIWMSKISRQQKS
jgi:hypothetical protein